jgi:hypothetical protein
MANLAALEPTPDDYTYLSLLGLMPKIAILVRSVAFAKKRE